MPSVKTILWTSAIALVAVGAVMSGLANSNPIKSFVMGTDK